MPSTRPKTWIVRSAAPLLVALLAACSSSSGGGGARTFTLHYHRAAADYAGWTLEPTAGAVEASVASTSTDGFGAVFAVTLEEGANAIVFGLRKGTEVDGAGSLTVDVSGATREAFVFSGYAEAFQGPLPAIPGPSQIALYYVRADGVYTGWGLHLWGDQVTGTVWSAPLQPAGTHPALGAGFLIPTTTGSPAGNCPPGSVCVIAHKGDEKDPGPDMSFDPGALGNIVFLTSGSTTVTSVPSRPGAPAIAGAAAHLLRRDAVAWNVTDPEAVSFELRWSPTADVVATDTGVVGGSVIPLAPNPAGLDASLRALAPFLRTWRAFTIAAGDLPSLEQGLKGQLVAVARKAGGAFHSATQVQTAFALDDLYPYAGPLGVDLVAGAPTFRVWAPTAQAVRIHVHDAAKAEVAVVDMTPGALGLWSHDGPAGWNGLFYRYELDVYHPVTSRIENVITTDPWATNLSTDGRYAQVVDLADPALRPAGWDALVKPPLDAPEDVVVYEGHVRDFSARDATVAADRRGKLLAFVTESGATRSAGLDHLAALAAAGVTHLHLLPSFDFATVEEDPANRVDLDDPFADLCAKNPAVPVALCGQFAGNTVAEAMATFPGDSDQQQAIAAWMRALDSYNWGYDPLHFGAPEGSYASTAEGTARILEFRRMIQGLAGVGLRVVMDVVYNHTNAAGLSDRSVLDKIVPGYYHRLHPTTGNVETSTCCANTASEHRMMEKLMIDTAVRWARDYKVDGFRFDLMGHHMKSNVIAVRDALAALTPGADGVDGSRIYLYGEGWDFGEVALQARGVNATQRNMAGTGVGTFNDRIRDAVRGGGPFDSANDMRKTQGFATGQWVDPNELATTTATDRADFLQAIDRIKIGMSGNLAEFRLLLAGGATGPGAAVGYNGAPTGYTQDPQEAVSYVSAHDNQTLFDIVQAKLPAGRPMADRVRAHVLAMATVALGQGVPFFHMGDDLLRSKSMERDSYDSGDWFNRVDWTGQESAWRSGLPSREKDLANWPLVGDLFADASIDPTPADIALASARFQELLRIRKGSPLFRLRTKAEVTTRVDFLNGGPSQTPGVVVMTVTDGACAGADLDPSLDALVVILNADVVAHYMTVPGAGGFSLHPELAASADPLARTSSVAGDVFTVPARTVAVFSQAQAGAQGTGLPCNTR